MSQVGTLAPAGSFELTAAAATAVLGAATLLPQALSGEAPTDATYLDHAQILKGGVGVFMLLFTYGQFVRGDNRGESNPRARQAKSRYRLFGIGVILVGVFALGLAAQASADGAEPWFLRVWRGTNAQGASEPAGEAAPNTKATDPPDGTPTASPATEEPGETTGAAQDTEKKTEPLNQAPTRQRLSLWIVAQAVGMGLVYFLHGYFSQELRQSQQSASAHEDDRGSPSHVPSEPRVPADEPLRMELTGPTRQVLHELGLRELSSALRDFLLTERDQVGNGTSQGQGQVSDDKALRSPSPPRSPTVTVEVPISLAARLDWERLFAPVSKSSDASPSRPRSGGSRSGPLRPEAESDEPPPLGTRRRRPR